MRQKSDIGLHVKEFKKRGNQIETGDKKYNLSDHDSLKNGLIRELESAEHNDPENMVFRTELKNPDIAELFDTKYVATTSLRYTLPRGIYGISDSNSLLKSSLPDDVKVDITIDDIRLRSNLTTNKTTRLTKNFSP